MASRYTWAALLVAMASFAHFFARPEKRPRGPAGLHKGESRYRGQTDRPGYD